MTLWFYFNRCILKNVKQEITRLGLRLRRVEELLNPAVDDFTSAEIIAGLGSGARIDSFYSVISRGEYRQEGLCLQPTWDGTVADRLQAATGVSETTGGGWRGRRRHLLHLGVLIHLLPGARNGGRGWGGALGPGSPGSGVRREFLPHPGLFLRLPRALLALSDPLLFFFFPHFIFFPSTSIRAFFHLAEFLAERLLVQALF